MKIVFLNIEGALHSETFVHKQRVMGRQTHDIYGELFSYNSVTNYEQLIGLTGATTIVTTNMRPDELNKIWSGRQLPGFAECIVPKYRLEDTRGLLIEEYFQKNPAGTRYVILDTKDDEYSDEMLQHLVLINPKHGFVTEKLKEALLHIQ